MKRTGFLILLVSVVSSFSTVMIYKYFDSPQQVIIRESSPAKYTNYTDRLFSDVAKRQFLSATPSDFTSAAAVVTPAVVNIRATTENDFDLWGGYGGSTGSGVIISPDGYIVTNNHVVEDSDDLEITLFDKRKMEAKVIGTDPSTDLALLKITDERNFPFLQMGNSDSLLVGEWVLAVGNPFNLESTVTAGIISAKGRNINILEDDYSIESFIQTDAAVNPGNSGGALVNTNGELVGINTAIITRSGKYEGYSFAIPVNLAQKIIRDLKDFGVVQRGFLGIFPEEITEETAESLGLASMNGAYISRVNGNSAAEDAGLEAKDVIVTINGNDVNSVPELQEQVARFRPGNTITIEYIRDGKKQKTEVTLKNKGNTTSLIGARDDDLLMKLGFELREMTDRERKNLKIGSGVYVVSILRGSAIEKTQMDPGYIITKVNDKRVSSVDEIITEFKNTKGTVMLEGFYENFPGEYYYAFKVEK